MGQPVYLQYPFVGGLDEKTAAVYLDPQNNQADIINGSFAYVGQIDKRYGLQAELNIETALLINATTIADSYLAPAHNSTTLSGFGDILFQNAWAWTAKSAPSITVSYVGGLPNCAPIRRPLPIVGNIVPLVVDGVTSVQGTVRVAAWMQTQSVLGFTSTYTIQGAFLDPTTGEGQLSIPPISFTADTVQLISMLYFPTSNKVALFVAVEASGTTSRTLYCYTLDPTSTSAIVWTIQAGATLALHNASFECLDVAKFNGDPSEGYIVLYAPASSGTELDYAYYVNYAQVSTGVVTGAANPYPDHPCYIQADWGADVVFAYSDNLATESIYLHYYSGDGLFTSITSTSVTPKTSLGFNNSAASLTGICRVSPAYGTGLNSQVYVSFASGVLAMGGLFTRTATTTVTPSNFIYYPHHMYPIARPAQPVDGLQQSTSYVHIVQPCVQTYVLNATLASDPISEQVTEYMLDYRIGPSGAQIAVVATVAPRQLAPYLPRWQNMISNNFHLPVCLNAAGTGVFTPIVVGNTGPSAVTQDVGGHWMVDFSFTSLPPFTVATINNTSQVRGGVPFRLLASGDSGASGVLEHGFIHFAEGITATPTGTGLTGTYSYAVCYLRQDANGNIERSAPVVLPAPVVLTNQACQIQFPTLSWWADKASYPQGYQVEIYRTVSLGSTYYCVARRSPQDFDTISGSPWLGGYTDSTADSVVRDAEVLPTTGGVLDSVNPPAALLHCAHRGRYAIVDETLRSVWFTTQESTGQGDVLYFNEALIVPFIEGGDITSIFSLDDKFIATKADSIWFMQGDGPGDTGQNSDWTIPQPVPTADVGCVSDASVALIPSGAIFLASTGFHMLGRGIDVSFIGKSVQDDVKQYSTCISSCVVPSAKQVRWCMQDGSGNQIILVYDYFLNQWTKHRYDHLSAKIAQLLLVDDVYTVITTDGSRYVESATSFLDKDLAGVSYFVPKIVKLPWVKVQPPQGYQMTRNFAFLGSMLDPAGLQADFAFDYNPSIKQTAIWTSQELDGGSQVSTHIDRRYCKGEAVQVTLTELDSTDKVSGQGINFISVGFDMAKIGDQYRKIPARLKR
jgi:hypothetical protein